MKLLATLILGLITNFSTAQIPKESLTSNIEDWQTKHEKGYEFEIKGKKAQANITRYHLERPEEKNDIIEVEYKGMTITLKFSRPIEQITTHADSLQKYYNYVSISRIYNNISSKGWDIYPRTGKSSLRDKGVTFISGGDRLSFDLNWGIYTVMGYKRTPECDNERSIEDGSVSDGCYVSVRKDIPLIINVRKVPLKTTTP